MVSGRLHHPRRTKKEKNVYVISSLCCRRRSGVLLTPGGLISVWKQPAHPLVFLSYTHRHWYMCSLCASKCFSVCDDILGAGDAQWNSSSFSVSTDVRRRRWTWTRWRLPWCWQVSPPARWSGVRLSKSTVSITTIWRIQYAGSLTAWRKKKKNSSVKPVICMFCFTFHSLTAVILWMHAEAQADKLPPPAVL